MASADDDTSSSFFPDDLDRNDTERDLYAILHINKDVRKSKNIFHIIYYIII
jgi:DnaJ-class molecular chaperone